jgi:uncharacterized protein (DUF2267 family)
MSPTGLDTFDTTVHKDDRPAAYLALRATLHALRDRITVEEVAQLGAQLPMLVRGFYYEGWDPTGKPVRVRRKETFLLGIAQQFPSADLIDPEKTARSVFRVLARRVSEGEIEDVKHVMPAGIRDLWP